MAKALYLGLPFPREYDIQKGSSFTVEKGGYMKWWDDDDAGWTVYTKVIGIIFICIMVMITFGYLFWLVYFDIPAKRKSAAPYLDSTLILSVDLYLVRGGLWGMGCETDARKVFKDVAKGTILGASIVGGLCCYAVDLLL